MSARRTIVVVAAAALLLRLVLLLARGDYLVYDEGYYLLLARSLRAGHGFTLNGLPHVALSPLQPMLVALASLLGVPDLWASRLLAAGSGALLVFPVAALTRRWAGERAAQLAAALVATAPALLAFVPFFPGRWSLYFGSEPLFLLLAVTALATAVRAVDEGAWRWWVAFGALAALAYLARLEGAVFGAATGVVAAGLVVARRRWQLMPRAAAALVAGFVVALPYFLYLHHTLGRWAVSGRVQAARSMQQEPSTPRTRAARRDALQAFVWGGDREALWRALYRLDPSGERMHSQYWGVAPAARAPAQGAGDSAAATLPSRASVAAEAPDTASPEPPLPSHGRQVLRAVRTVLPWWLILLSVPGLTWVRRRGEAAAWLAPCAVAVVVPALFAYVEPRAFLLLVPAACLLAGATLARAAEWLPPRRLRLAAGLGGALLLAQPLWDASRAWNQQAPLQRAASARRAVGVYLGEHLAADERIVAWHPAVAIWARREWRVLPYDSLARVLHYARAQRANVLVFTTLEPSPLRDPPRAFTVILTDSVTSVTPGNIHLDQVDATALVFVGRLAPAAAVAPATP